MSDKPSFKVDTFNPELKSLDQSKKEAATRFLEVINNCDIDGILERTGYLVGSELNKDKARSVANEYLSTHNQDSVSSAVVELVYSDPSEIEEKLANLIVMMIDFREEAELHTPLEAGKWFNIPLHYLPTEILVGVTKVIEHFSSPVEA